MKRIVILAGAVFLLALGSGCVEPVGYGGAYGGVYGEYPTTYYGSTYVTPGYTYSRPLYRYHRWTPYDRDHYWERGRHYRDRRVYERRVYEHHHDRD